MTGAERVARKTPSRNVQKPAPTFPRPIFYVVGFILGNESFWKMISSENRKFRAPPLRNRSRVGQLQRATLKYIQPEDSFANEKWSRDRYTSFWMKKRKENMTLLHRVIWAGTVAPMMHVHHSMGCREQWVEKGSMRLHILLPISPPTCCGQERNSWRSYVKIWPSYLGE